MSGINVSRWLMGGIVAGIVIWLFEGLASLLYMSDMETILERYGLEMQMTASTWILTVVLSLITGLILVFFYAAVRPRFGPGPKTAVIVAVVLWTGGTLVSLVGYHMVGLYPVTMLALWGLVGLIEMIVAGLIGCRIYREAEG